MRQVLKSGLMITLSLMTLAGCNGSFPLLAVNDGNYSLASSKVTTANTQNVAGFQGGNGKEQGKGMPRPEMNKPQGGGLLPQLNLTTEQRSQIDTLLQANRPAQPDQAKMEVDRTAMDAVRKEIDTAFVSDNFDVASLKAKLEALKPAKPDDTARITQEANTIIKVYALLTDEQKKLAETKLAEFSANAPKLPPVGFNQGQMMPPPPNNEKRFDQAAIDLNLTEAQKTAFAEVMQPPTNIVKPEPQVMFEKMKATQEAVLAELKTGSASADKIVAILKSNAPEKVEPKNDELDRLAKLHTILNAEQRAKFIANRNKAPKMNMKQPFPPNQGKPMMIHHN